MQKATIKKLLKEQIIELKQYLNLFEEHDKLSGDECETMIQCLNQMSRSVAVYAHLKELATLADEAVKIQEASPVQEERKQEMIFTVTQIQPDPSSIQQQVPTEQPTVKAPEPEKAEPVVQHKKVEMGLNDKYRIMNELFATSNEEFNMAIQQLNAIANWKEAEIYLNSLMSLYQWKEENQLVKTFYTLVQRKFN